MALKETFGAIGGLALMLVMLTVGGALLAAFIFGGVWVSEHLLPWLAIGSLIVLGVVVFVLLPLAIPRATRGFSAISMLVASYVFGATLWMYGLLVTYFTWGVFAVVIGLVVAGVGVVPIAVLATIIKGMWEPFFTLILLAIATYSCRIGAMSLVESLGRHAV